MVSLNCIVHCSISGGVIEFISSYPNSFSWYDVIYVKIHPISISYDPISSLRYRLIVLIELSIVSMFILYFYCWYFAYKSMCKLKCCFPFTYSFWHMGKTVTVQYNRYEVMMWRGIDNRDKDRVDSATNNSVIFSFTTKLFQSCTAVKELHLEIMPNQIFTLLGPVWIWVWSDG